MMHMETSAYTTAYERPAVYAYVTNFQIMSNWNIVCKTNLHHVLKYCYDIVLNNIYTKKCVFLKTVCLDAAYGSIYNADMGYEKPQYNDNNDNINV